MVNERRSSKRARDVHASSSENPNQPYPLTNLTLYGKKGEEKDKVCEEHFMKLCDFDDSNILDVLEYQGWVKLVSTSMEVIASLVIYFFQHFDMDIDGDNWVLMIKMSDGNNYTYTNVDFERDFGIGKVVEFALSDGTIVPNYWDVNDNGWPIQLAVRGLPDSSFMAEEINHFDKNGEIELADTDAGIFRYLSGDDKMLVKIIRSIIYPCHSKCPELPMNVGIILSILRKKVKIDFAKLMLAHMRTAGNNRKLSRLPYGGIITHIMRGWQIPGLDYSARTIRPMTLCRRTYLMQHSVMVERRLITDWEVPFLSDEEKAAFDIAATALRRRRVVPPPAEHQEDAPQDTDQDPYQGMTSSYQPTLEEKVDRLQASVDRNERKQNKILQLLRVVAQACNCRESDIMDSISSPEHQ